MDRENDTKIYRFDEKTLRICTKLVHYAHTTSSEKKVHFYRLVNAKGELDEEHCYIDVCYPHLSWWTSLEACTTYASRYLNERLATANERILRSTAEANCIQEALKDIYKLEVTGFNGE